jgi:hypothetical protein
MKTIQDIMDAYFAKWDKYIQDHNIPEDDERRGCWGWQFDETNDFITTPELLLACYIYAYDDDAVIYLKEHFIPGDCLYEMAQASIGLLTSAVQ